MKLNFLLFSIVALSHFIFFENTHAGVEGHGGGAFVCRDKNGEIKNEPLSVEFLDLWEANENLHLHIQRRADESWQLQAKEAMLRLSQWQPNLYELATLYYLEIMALNSSNSLAQSKVIAPPVDAEPDFIKPGCPLEGAAVYHHSKALLTVSHELLNAMSNTDKAGLYVHEAVCQAMRFLGHDELTTRCRRVVGYLFSSIPILSPLQNPPYEKFYCATTDNLYGFYVFKNGDKNLVAKFLTIDGNPMIQPVLEPVTDPYFIKIFESGPAPTFSITLGEAIYISPNPKDFSNLSISPDSEETYKIALSATEKFHSKGRCYFQSAK